MPDTKLLDKSLGSRHRAALGITEETDAVVVVVSEGAGQHQLLLQRQHRHQPGRGVPSGKRCSGSSASATRKRAPKPATKRGTGVVAQTGTGSFRVTLPPGPPSDARDTRETRETREPREVRETTAGHVLLPPRGEPPPKSEREASVQLNTRPMAPAKPIEATRTSQTPDEPTPPREE